MQNETLLKMLSTEKLFGSTTLTIRQNMKDFVRGPSSDPKFPRNKVRRYLSQYGFRGSGLKAEVERICKFHSPEGDWKYPYGWSEQDLSGPMRRMFGLKRSRNLVMLDEFWQILES
ncbi:hypothetical protein [Yersinia mollaretii]|uniref:hypothetical protein n=1 Tax=Yersinia mollaretii TaxID=33060 RepID=UPI0011A40835|nr:hypothetical protein [Yersinia mollaretii]